MAEPGFKFSRLGAGGDDQAESREAFAGHVESAPESALPAASSTNSNAMTRMMFGNGQGARGSVKAVRRTTLLLMALVGVICLLSVVLSGLALNRVMSIEPSGASKAKGHNRPGTHLDPPPQDVHHSMPNPAYALDNTEYTGNTVHVLG